MDHTNVHFAALASDKSPDCSPIDVFAMDLDTE